MKKILIDRLVVVSIVAVIALAGAVCASAQDTVDSVLRPPKGAQVAIVVVRQDGSRSTITAVLGSRPLPQP